MKGLLLAAALVAVAFAPLAPLAAAEPGPCPSRCTPPEPCGWPPDVRKEPLAYAGFWVACAEGLVAWPHGPVLP